MTPEEQAAAEAAVAASQQTPEQIAAAQAAATAAAEVTAKEIYTLEELAKITPTNIDLDRVDPAYRPIVENTIRDYKELQKDHTKKSQASKDAEREREYWKRVALEKEQTTVKPTVETEIPSLPGIPSRPTLDQFDTTEKYEDALFSWYEQKKSGEQAAARKKTEQEEALVKFNRAAEKLRQEYDDFDTVIETPVFSPAMRFAILQSDNGPLMAYHLGKTENRDTVDRIRSLPPEAQFYEIGKLETQLLIAKNTKKVPGAPAPITPVGLSGGGSGEKDTSKMNDDEWFAYEKQQRLIKLKQKTGG